MKKQTIRNNKKLLTRYKTKCCICGEDTYCCLELHHIRDKGYNVSQAVRYLPTAQFVKELEKTIVVCSNCHKKLHSGIITYTENGVQ